MRRSFLSLLRVSSFRTSSRSFASRWRAEKRERAQIAMESPETPKIVVDLSLTHGMTLRETRKLANQIQLIYGSNLNHASPVHLMITSCDENSLLWKEMSKGFRHSLKNIPIDFRHDDFWTIFENDLSNLIYLSPDSPNNLVDVNDAKVLVLGGIVDHQINKCVSLNRASSHKVATAKLPILEHFSTQKSYSTVLSINQDTQRSSSWVVMAGHVAWDQHFT
ncbi:tRNA methyltransferase 10 homolog B-like isoform X3 [Oscarella lobularis]|uniref:tRNA methyltransferase 10 homolog B-like isoform X3 n=1 Tax=Oscarella lobularis TaxID=121494 RepID=UPI0033138C18